LAGDEDEDEDEDEDSSSWDGGKTARFTNEYTEYALHNIDLW